MNDNDAKQQKIGFMIAVGLLLERSEPAVRDNIIATLKSFGGELCREVDTLKYAAIASDAGINPCPPPLVWNPITHECE